MRGQVLAFDTIQQLTRGNPLRARAFLDYLDPTRGIYTALLEEAGNISLAGQITHAGASRSSNLSFITPTRGLNSPELVGLIDHLSEQAGEWGTFYLLAEVDEHSHSFDVLRTSGFSVYAWQRVWRYQTGSANMPLTPEEITWKSASDRDQIPIKSLCQSLVPAFVQPVDSVFDKRLEGLICHEDCGVMGYADLIFGREGTWVQPYIHPEAKFVPAVLAELLHQVELRGSHSIYICVRSYQAWIESALEELPVLASPRQALMVRHLAVLQKAVNPIRVAAMENSRRGATMARVDTSKRI